MEFAGFTLPAVLVEVITDHVVANTTDWQAWEEHRAAVEDAMRREPCACGGMMTFRGGPRDGTQSPIKKRGNWCQRNDRGCPQRNEAEYEARIGERPMAALDRRLAYARAWDSVCHASRLDDACWETLLREDYPLRWHGQHEHEIADYGPLATLALARPLLGLPARDVLARLRKTQTVQQLVDIHRALLLDDVEAFLDVVRMQPRLLIEEVYTGGNGKSLGLRDHQRGEVQVDPRVAESIRWLPRGRYTKVVHTLRHIVSLVKPQSIMRLVEWQGRDSDELDSDGD